jgi:hypothetical protein
MVKGEPVNDQFVCVLIAQQQVLDCAIDMVRGYGQGAFDRLLAYTGSTSWPELVLQ